ncbi:hypothetical protein [Actinobacillus equuli]|uniref:hypothetical protein n=1 Tax=Actinobacillus equuli TaxID=718 RepID=UPI002442A76E|nr:hypothetical protein [Actinobacillus equuli]WGE74490.1 hypothetical protein NYR81_05565 [Actinobacillus equuli subsp. haemolyticus]
MAKYANRIDSLIMLEAAVADNAITGNYTREKNPAAMELFPFAHKSVKSIRIMYSQEDGVLGADNRALDLDDGISDATRGSYPLKYSVLANRNNAIADYYPYANHPNSSVPQQKVAAQMHNAIQLQCRDNMGQNNTELAKLCDYMKSQPLFHRPVIESKVRTLVEQEIEQVNANWTTDLNILRPWSHFRRFEKGADYTEHIIDVLTKMIFKAGWKLSPKELEIRPALGYVGEKFTAPRPEQDIDKNLAKKYPVDTFIKALYDKQFFFHNQSEYFTTHSAIKDLDWEEMLRTEAEREKTTNPTRFYQIYTITYKREIMDRYIKGTSTFGRY